MLLLRGRTSWGSFHLKHTLFALIPIVLLARAALSAYSAEVRSSSGYIYQGENVTLICNLRDTPRNGMVVWYKLLQTNGYERVTIANRDQLTPPFMITRRYAAAITSEIRSPATNLANITAELYITGIQKEDEGTLGCRFTNRSGTTTNIVVYGHIMKMQIDQHRADTEINHNTGDVALFDYPATEASAVACHIEATTDDVVITMTLNHVRLTTGFSKLVNWRTVSGRDTGLERRHAVIHYRSASFAPTVEDEGRQLECIAHVRHSSSQMTTYVLLSVRHAPEGNCSAALLGGDDVRIRCTARSNPRYEEANWSWTNADGRQVRIPANETGAARGGGATSCQDCSSVSIAAFELVMSHDEFASGSSYFLLIRNIAGSASFIVPSVAAAAAGSAVAVAPIQPATNSGAEATHGTAVGTTAAPRQTTAAPRQTTALRAGTFSFRSQTEAYPQLQPEQPALPRIQSTIGVAASNRQHHVSTPSHRISAAASICSSAAVIWLPLTCALLAQQSVFMH